MHATIKENMIRVVVFHMDGCPHCKAVTGKSSVLREGAGDLAPIYEIESSDPLSRNMGITSFPSIFVVTPIVAFAFEGKRTPEDFRKFVLEKMGQSRLLAKISTKTNRANERM
jgi:hypothetical protein